MIESNHNYAIVSYVLNLRVQILGILLKPKATDSFILKSHFFCKLESMSKIHLCSVSYKVISYQEMMTATWSIIERSDLINSKFKVELEST